MKSRVKNALCPMCGSSTNNRVVSEGLNATKMIWDMTLMVTLRNVYGFGNKRIKDFFDSLEQTQKWFEDNAKITDTIRDEYSNMDAVIIRMMKMLDGIEYKDILNLDGIVIKGKDLMKVAEKISNDRKRGYKNGGKD